jgi:hypothetical protein
MMLEYEDLRIYGFEDLRICGFEDLCSRIDPSDLLFTSILRSLDP